MLAALSLSWGTSYLMIKVAVAEIPPLSLAAARLVLGAMVLYALLRLQGERLAPWGSVWLRLGIMAALGSAVPAYLLTWGSERIDSSLSAILFAVIPLLTMVMAHIAFDDEPMTGRRVAGVSFGLVGVAILVGQDAQAHLMTNVWGQLSILGAALGFSFSTVVGRGLPRGAPLAHAATLLVLASMMIIVPSLVIDQPWQLATPSVWSWGAVVWLGLLATALTNFVLIKLVTNVGANFVATNNYLTPAVGIIAGAWVLGEELPPRALGALAVILGGIAIAESARWARPHPPAGA